MWTGKNEVVQDKSIIHKLLKIIEYRQISASLYSLMVLSNRSRRLGPDVW